MHAINIRAVAVRHVIILLPPEANVDIRCSHSGDASLLSTRSL
jgi:hypothetical protein